MMIAFLIDEFALDKFMKNFRILFILGLTFSFRRHPPLVYNRSLRFLFPAIPNYFLLRIPEFYI